MRVRLRIICVTLLILLYVQCCIVSCVPMIPIDPYTIPVGSWLLYKVNILNISTTYVNVSIVYKYTDTGRFRCVYLPPSNITEGSIPMIYCLDKNGRPRHINANVTSTSDVISSLKLQVDVDWVSSKISWFRGIVCHGKDCLVVEVVRNFITGSTVMIRGEVGYIKMVGTEEVFSYLAAPLTVFTLLTIPPSYLGGLGSVHQREVRLEDFSVKLLWKALREGEVNVEAGSFNAYLVEENRTISVLTPLGGEVVEAGLIYAKVWREAHYGFPLKGVVKLGLIFPIGDISIELVKVKIASELGKTVRTTIFSALTFMGAVLTVIVDRRYLTKL